MLQERREVNPSYLSVGPGFHQHSIQLWLPDLLSISIHLTEPSSVLQCIVGASVRCVFVIQFSSGIITHPYFADSISDWF